MVEGKRSSKSGRPNRERQAIVNRFPESRQPSLLNPVEAEIITGRYRIRPPLTIAEISYRVGVPVGTLQNCELRAISKIIKALRNS